LSFNILVIGDIVGKPGRTAVQQALPGLREEMSIDFVIANAENIAGGSGMTKPLLAKLFSSGVDAVTSGDHVWKRREIAAEMENEPRLLRPANLPAASPGRGWTVIQNGDGRLVGIISLLGRVYMNSLLVDDPFQAADAAIKEIAVQTNLIIVDMHAEATSEKIAMGWHLDGRVTAVIGTHTHVPTADARVLPRGSAYVTDLGMTGPYESVLGRRIDRVLHKFTTGMPAPFDVARGDVRFCGALVTASTETGMAVSIERIEKRIEDGNI